ncbi:A/G-specific adenine glycosylase [Sphingomonas sp. Leaf231]|uniref:A/G-specific adenine glycosylase n=1 Tax=Sphingomonas sp. Leaf231 TaxID=1736301 RepID=UPI0006F5A905|nr:A/G-specific adenine glycosylase [Sphingomonas sp. Leaf231]KQN93776.1 A/G-specific adenine glycosylase [Sphingomonas sp. Leaf231]
MDAKHRIDIATPLLAWYDRHRRDLPWRAAAGDTPDAYRVWLSEVMLQQTTVATVRPRFTEWTRRWPTFADLAAAEEADVMAAWAGLGYYARARNLLAAARAIAADHGGRLPDTEAALRTLPGFGDYTAAAVAAIAFGRRAVVVDANVERVVARLFAIDMPLPAARRPIRAAADTITPEARAGDFAQAMMDLGSAICTPRRPRCLLCPLGDRCAAQATGTPDGFPVKKPRAARPHRHGTIFWLQRDDAVLLMRRPDKGLLGGMRALPTGPWADVPPLLTGAPAAVDWRFLDEQVAHGFTHFTIDLRIAVARTHVASNDGEWWPLARLDDAGLPTVFAKAAVVARRRA